MNINSKDFRVRPGARVKLKEWPTMVKPFCKSKKRYQKLLAAHVGELSALQQLHYASHHYALLLIFQGMDAGGKDGANHDHGIGCRRINARRGAWWLIRLT